MFHCLVSQDNVDSMTVRLMAAEEELAQERRDHAGTRERLHHAAMELESLPLLQAQVSAEDVNNNLVRIMSLGRGVSK